MFIFSVKTTKKQIVSLAVCAVMLLAVAVVALTMPRKGIRAAPDGSRAAARVQFLEGLGYTITADSEQQETITLPASFDEVLLAYNTLQQAAGMDLLPFAGRTLQRFTYAVSNYPNEPQTQAHLYVWQGKIVGGDIASEQQNGFQHGLLALI